MLQSSNMPIDPSLFALGPTCESCGLYRVAEKKCMASRGNSLDATYAFINDTPAKIDAVKGYQWADRKLEWALEQAGIEESQCYFTSLIKCAVRDIKPSDSQISACLYYILQELAVVRPKVIFVTGKQSFQVLTKHMLRGGLGTARGSTYVANMPWGKVHVVPTWTLSFAQFQERAANDLVADLFCGKALISPARKTNYEWVNSPEALVDRVDYIIDAHRSGKLQYGVVAVDSETTNLLKKGTSLASYSLKNNIGTVQICWADGEAIAIPVVRPDSAFNNPTNMRVFRTQLGRILNEVPVVGQNYKYDELYFRVKLGLRTRFMVFDTMLAHQFMYCGSMPNDLGFIASRHLGWRSHKRDVDAALEAMDESIRCYGWLPHEVVTAYGCTDTDATLQSFGVFRSNMLKEDYSKYRNETTIIYPNMLKAFTERVMFPWRALVDMELEGATIETALIPEVTAELEASMETATSAFTNTPPYAVWILDHTRENPKRKKYKKQSVYYLTCMSCGHVEQVEKGTKTTPPCAVCRGGTAVKRKMENTSEYTINYDEPEQVVDHLNLRSPPQLSKYFYDKRYLGLPTIPKKEGSTDKHVRKAIIEMFGNRDDKQIHVRSVQAVGEFMAASKLHSAYAVRIDDYLFVKSDGIYTSGDATSEFECNTGANRMHTNYKQHGTKSGRLCFSESTKILTDKGELTLSELGSGTYLVRTHLGNWKPITHVYYKGMENMYRITTSDGFIECTMGHRIWHQHEWMSAGKLIAHCMNQPEGDRYVVSVEPLGEQNVWDISVEDDHSFFAQGMFHHNSTTDPSLHTIPRESRIKTMYVSRFGEDGLIGQADLAQAEVRGFVIETGDKALRDAFARGEDPYILTAAEVMNLAVANVTKEIRQDFKSVILGMLFGRGAVAVAEQTGRAVDYIREIIADFFRKKPQIKEWQRRMHDFAHKHRCTITRFGRIRPLRDELRGDDPSMTNHAENVAINHPIQGMVGDIAIDSVARINYRLRREGLRSVLFNTVHDSVIVDIFVPELMRVVTILWEEFFALLPTYFPWINVPFNIDIDIGPSWGEKASLKMTDNSLTLESNPARIHEVTRRLRRHFEVNVTGPTFFNSEKNKLSTVLTLTAA